MATPANELIPVLPLPHGGKKPGVTAVAEDETVLATATTAAAAVVVVMTSGDATTGT